MPNRRGTKTFLGFRTRPLGAPRIHAALALAAVLTILAGVAGAESFRVRLDDANARLRRGDVDGAMTAYRDLQTDEPESALLYYDIGCAEYDRALSEADIQAPEDASASFETAKASFGKALTASDPGLRQRAQFNQANCTAQIAKQAVAAQQYDKTVEAFTKSVQEYEDFLRLFPDHASARKNLDHMRYLLKKMLQNPPPPPEQQQGEGEQNNEQDQQQNDQSKDQSQESQGQDEQQKNDQQQEQQEIEEQDQSSEQEQQQSAGEQAASAQEEDQSSENGEATEPQDRQNVEAILQSLEDMDNREMRDTMDENERRGTPRESDWW